MAAASARPKTQCAPKARLETLQRLAQELLHDIAADAGMAGRCKALSARLFSPEAVVKQITAALAG